MAAPKKPVLRGNAAMNANIKKTTPKGVKADTKAQNDVIKKALAKKAKAGNLGKGTY